MRKLFLLFMALLATTCLWAHDFEVDGIYYNHLGGNNVEVTYKGNSYYSSAYSGEVTIPETVTYNGITYNVTSIGDYAFDGCSSLASITIPNSVTSIGYWAFYDCSSLTSITIPNSVTSIGWGAFIACSSLTSITIPNSVTSIGGCAFYDCSSLTSITIPNSVTSIGEQAFYECSSLISVTIPNSVTSIGDAAFSSCSSLTSVTIPNSVTSIGKRAFEWCSSLKKTNYTGDIASWCDIKFGSCNANPIYHSHNFYINDQEIKDLVIPNTVDSIHHYAFAGCSSLTSVTIPNSVTSIGDRAFYGCSSLTSIKIEATTPPSLGSDAFPSNPTAIYIPDNTLSTYQQAWGNEYAFVNNENTFTLHVVTPGTLEDLIFDAGTRPVLVAKLILTGTLNDADFTCMRETMTSLVDVDLSGITNTSGVNFDDKENLVRIILPTNLTSIGDRAFFKCTSLTSITIGNSVTSIGECAFGGCTSLTSVTIPNSVTSIGDAAFDCCYSLTSITIPNNVTSIGKWAFDGCSSLTSMVVEEGNTTYDSRDNCNAIIETATNTLIESCQNTIIPNSVTSIGEDAFSGCRSLTSITIPNSVTSIGNYAFSNCSFLTSVTIPNSVTSIGDWAFSVCSSLASITIPNSVTSIGNAAFRDCRSLTSVTIGNSVTSIGEDAFYYCDALTSITCLGTTPPNASDLGAPISTCTLTVPHSAYNAYLRHAYWGQFLNINTGYLVSLQTNNEQWGEVTGVGLYPQDSTITITATPNEGYTFLRWSDGNTDNPRTFTVTQDTIFIAEFAIEGGCLVTFVDWDGTVLSSVSVVPGEAATAPADPTREGYTFIGWDKDFSAVTDHMTVTAQYQINRYRVRFFDDDILLKTDSVEYQSAAVAPANPYHEGYTFIGWDQAFDSITSDLDVYAQYEMGEDRDMTIVFTNGNDDSEVLSQSITIKIPAAPEIAGFTFLGWKATDAFISDVITIQAIYEADVPSSAPEEYINPANPAQKLLRNGQVYILQDGQTYTIQGQQL